MTPRYRILCAALALAVCATPALADDYLADFYGYDFWWPSNMPPGNVGDCYNALGFVPDANPLYLVLDEANNEYTFSLKGACISNVTNDAGRIIWDFTGGTFDIYCDSLLTGTAADFGTNPPNGTAPSSFEDGECILGGDFGGMQVVVDPLAGTADLFGSLDFVRGTQLGNIPVNQRNGWTLAGLRAGAPGLPEGYFWQIDGQLFLEAPVPAERRSWGEIKRNLGEEDGHE